MNNSSIVLNFLKPRKCTDKWVPAISIASGDFARLSSGLKSGEMVVGDCIRHFGDARRDVSFQEILDSVDFNDEDNVFFFDVECLRGYSFSPFESLSSGRIIIRRA